MSDTIDLDYLFDKYTAAVKEASGLRNALKEAKRQIADMQKEVDKALDQRDRLSELLSNDKNIWARVARDRAETIGVLNKALAVSQAQLEAGKYYNGQAEKLVG